MGAIAICCKNNEINQTQQILITSKSLNRSNHIDSNRVFKKCVDLSYYKKYDK